MASAKQELHTEPLAEGAVQVSSDQTWRTPMWFLQDVTRTQRAESFIIGIFLQIFCFCKISLANDKVTGQIHLCPLPLLAALIHWFSNPAITHTAPRVSLSQMQSIFPCLISTPCLTLSVILFPVPAATQQNLPLPPSQEIHTPGISSVPTALSSSSALRGGITGIKTELQLFKTCLLLIWEVICQTQPK